MRHRHGRHGGGGDDRQHWSEDRPWGGRGGRGGKHRMFDGTELRLLLLHLIGQEPRHGYDLIRAIDTLTQGGYSPSPGMVYPILTLLADMELVDQEAEGQRKKFSITEQGRHTLADSAAVVEQLLQRLQNSADERGRVDAAPVRRAMHNLKSVLLEKLSNSDDPKIAYDIAALVDEAAQKIERLGT